MEKKFQCPLREIPGVDENTIIDHLEELAERFAIQIRYEAIRPDEDSIRTPGGLCLFKGEYVLIINTDTTILDRINTLATALKHFDLDQVYIRPVLRELLDRIPEQRSFGVSSEHGG